MKQAAQSSRRWRKKRASVTLWAFHARLFDAEGDGPERSKLERIAAEVGLDLGRFRTALDSGRYRQKVEDDAALAANAGIDSSPSAVINGYYLVGAQPAQAFRRAIHRALRDAN